ncbi:glycine N-methyltransferase [Toxorhynchites rutilus septentrionalis]|uniref:glycine N-methyltransferase n=1 Tax=Toxorhynchites rutilus septentrionalis TaxID=329112 RepID=UPI002479D6BE|nr:glycine N-methyltransferase [Toxorhynchites rutilus septentrionalis]XP_055644835.1 glycine N-methyltransferase [Toxorhynchites rutilus septentrionalis]
MSHADAVFQSRSNGISAEGVRDQYADGKAAQVWEVFIGDKKSRTENYRNFLVEKLRDSGCKRVLDVACGTGVDSILLLEEGFEVVSIDASDKMLKYALKERWNRRKEPSFDNWVIEEANWLTLYDDIQHLIGDGFDAVICLGNSFAHLLDSYGDQRKQIQAIENFEKCVKPGGLLLIDHRNYDNIMDTGATPSKCIYYNSRHTTDIKTSVLYVAAKPTLVTMDYVITTANGESNEFRLSYYPHKLAVFEDILKSIFSNATSHEIYGDFKPLNKVTNPAFYIHIVEKSK